MGSDKPTILKNSKKGYQLQDGDVDLQGTAMNPLESIEVAKSRALDKLGGITSLELRLTDFATTMWAIAYLQSSTKRMGVQFECERESEAGRWHLEINIDHPDLPPSEFGKKALARRPPNGPDRPHVGYTATLKSGQGSGKRTSGHIFVDDLPAARPDPRSAKLDPDRYLRPR